MQPRRVRRLSPPKRQQSPRRGVSSPQRGLRAKPVKLVKLATAECGVHTQAGRIPGEPEKVNQDSYLVVRSLGGYSDMQLFGVCDGHGKSGREVSTFIKTRLPVVLASSPVLRSNPQEALTHSVLQCHQELQASPVNTELSGSTLVLVLIKGTWLYCANVGDSRAVLAREIPSALSAGQYWQAIALSRDHKPDDPEECKRIHHANGRVASFVDEYGDALGPARVWLQEEDVPGLAMSRALGDSVAGTVGVVPTPELLCLQLTSADKFLVLGSDGVFEFLENEAVLGLVLPGWKAGSPEQAASQLVAAAATQWEQNEEVVDDITAVCVFLAPY